MADTTEEAIAALQRAGFGAYLGPHEEPSVLALGPEHRVDTQHTLVAMRGATSFAVPFDGVEKGYDPFKKLPYLFITPIPGVPVLMRIYHRKPEVLLALRGNDAVGTAELWMTRDGRSFQILIELAPPGTPALHKISTWDGSIPKGLCRPSEKHLSVTLDTPRKAGFVVAKL